jgi:hypothetical protein
VLYFTVSHVLSNAFRVVSLRLLVECLFSFPCHMCTTFRPVFILSFNLCLYWFSCREFAACRVTFVSRFVYLMLSVPCMYCFTFRECVPWMYCFTLSCVSMFTYIIFSYSIVDNSAIAWADNMHVIISDYYLDLKHQNQHDHYLTCS